MFTVKDISDLRQRTGVGMMDCKKALEATEGNIDKAIEWLRENGLAKAAKKAGRIASQGVVDSYIHLGGKIGVLVEVNCESDFVGRSEQFKALVHDIAMQIAAAKPLYVSKDEVPADVVESERKILIAEAMNEPKPKPEAIMNKIIDGKIRKYFEEICLLDQAFVKDPSKTIEQLIAEAIGNIGEKISVRRFVRYEMGEGLEKKEDNFAQEIMDQVNKKQSNNYINWEQVLLFPFFYMEVL